MEVIEVANTRVLSWFINLAALGWLFSTRVIDSESACLVFNTAVDNSIKKDEGVINPSFLLDMIEFLLIEVTASKGVGIDGVLREGLGKHVELARDRFKELKEDGNLLCGNLRACNKIEQQFESVGMMLV
jgi:hypothetical protein